MEKEKNLMEIFCIRNIVHYTKRRKTFYFSQKNIHWIRLRNGNTIHESTEQYYYN